MLVTNKVNSATESKNVYDKLSAVVDRFLDINLMYLRSVPSDESIAKAVMKQTPVTIAYPSSAPARAFREIRENLERGEASIPDDRKGLASLFARVFGNKKRT